MKRIGPIDFPETQKEADTWTNPTHYHAIHRRVLLVAKMRVEGMWSCYTTPVPGQNHDHEAGLWQTEGVKCLESIARAAFPEFSEIPYAK